LRSPVGQGHENYVPLVVTADASNTAIGAVLSQKAWSGGSIGVGELLDHPCGYLSKLLSETQRNYSTFDRELLAIMFALQKWRQLLVAAIFTIITDHLPLVYIMKTKFPNGTNNQASGRTDELQLHNSTQAGCGEHKR
jgi:RNase H-like domain found in reverse transcriptase